MIDMILPFIDESNARSVPPYQVFIKSQRNFVNKKFMQFQNSKGHESQGIRLLRYILQQVDYDYMDKLVNNYERYSYHIKSIHQDIASIINPATRGRGHNEKFITKHSSITEEFIIPVQDLNNITQLPLETMSWNRWKDVKPMHLWNHDSSGYTLNLLLDRVTFDLPPLQAIFTLNITALIFKYYVWSKNHKHNEADQDTVQKIPQQYFLHKYIVAGWVYDLTDIWLIKLINQLFEVEDELDLLKFKSQNLITDNQYGQVVHQSYSGMLSVNSLFQDLKKNVDPGSFISSKLLMKGSIYNRLMYTERYLPIPDLRQYEFLKWLRDKDMMTLCINLYKLRPSNPKTVSMLLNVKRDFNRKLLARPWNTIKNTVLKYNVEREMYEFRDGLLSQ